MSPSKPLGIALLGEDLLEAQAYLSALAQLKSYATLLAIYSKTLESASWLAERAQATLFLPAPPATYHGERGAETNLDALLLREDIDAVIIAVPRDVSSLVTAALDRGKHVLSESPFMTVDDGRDLVLQYEQKWKDKLVWKVSESSAVEPAFRKVSELVKGGKIGTVAWWKLSNVYALSHVMNGHEGGLLKNRSIHSAAILRTALGSRPASISAHVFSVQGPPAPLDTLTAIARSADGSHGLIEISVGAPVSSRSEVRSKITGQSGWIDLEPEWEGFRVTLRRQISSSCPASSGVCTNGGEIQEEFEFPRMQGTERVLENFVDVIRSGVDEGGEGEPWQTVKDVAFFEAGMASRGSSVDMRGFVQGYAIK